MPPVSVAQAFALALQQHQAGRLAEAEALYRQILAVEPRHSETLHFLGVIARQAGRNDLAVEWICHSIGINPTNAHLQ
jgi:Flp pilus assembly protein TadD